MRDRRAGLQKCRVVLARSFPAGFKAHKASANQSVAESAVPLADAFEKFVAGAIRRQAWLPKPVDGLKFLSSVMAALDELKAGHDAGF